MLKHKNTGHTLSGHSTLYSYYGFKRSEDESKLSKTSLMTDFFSNMNTKTKNGPERHGCVRL